MFLYLVRQFLTLVLILNLAVISMAFAKPHSEMPQTTSVPSSHVQEEASEAAPEEVPTPYANDLMSITEVGDEPKNISEFAKHYSKENYFYPYRQSLTPRVGLLFGLRDSSDEDDIMNVLLGFNYLVKRAASPHWELGADLSLASHGHINVMRRHIHNERGSFRPYYKYGFTHKLVSDEKFASFSNFENYLARVGVGFEDILRPPRSLRLELEAAVGIEDTFIIFTYGYSYGW